MACKQNLASIHDLRNQEAAIQRHSWDAKHEVAGSYQVTEQLLHPHYQIIAPWYSLCG